MKKRRQRAGNNQQGLDKEPKVLGRKEDVVAEIKKKREEEERPIPLSLQSPLHSASLCQLPRQQARGRKRREMKRERKCAEQKLSQLKNSMFLLRRGADLLHQLERGFGASESLTLVYFTQKPEEEFTYATNYASKANQIMLLCRSCFEANSVRKTRTYWPPFRQKKLCCCSQAVKKKRC